MGHERFEVEAQRTRRSRGSQQSVDLRRTYFAGDVSRNIEIIRKIFVTCVQNEGQQINDIFFALHGAKAAL